jgi:hypothetical protein
MLCARSGTRKRAASLATLERLVALNVPDGLRVLGASVVSPLRDLGQLLGRILDRKHVRVDTLDIPVP